MCTARGSDVRPGVPLASLQLRRFRVAGVGQCALPGGLRRFCVAGVGQSPLPRGRMYAHGVPLASLGLRRFCVAALRQCALPGGRMYALASLWRPLGSAAFAWQACDNLHCQGVGCTSWRPSGVPWAPPLLRGRRVTISIAKGSDVRPGVPLASLGLRRFCVAGVGQCALPGGRMWQAWDNVLCQGVSGVPWAPPLLRGRRGAISIAKGSDVRPGVPLASLGLRRFCVAGLGQCALPGGRMFAVASLWRPLGSAAFNFAWQAWKNAHCQGECKVWRPSGVPWAPQAWGNLHCQGVECTPWRPWRPWRPLGSAGSLTLVTDSHSLTHSHSSLTLTLTLTHTLTHSLTLARTHASTHALTHTHSHSLTLTHTHSHSLTLTHTHSLTLTHTHSHSLTLTHTHSHSLTLTHSHSLTHTHTHSHSLTLTHTHSHSLTLTHTHSHTLTLTHTHSHSLTLTHTHSHSLTLTH